MIKIRILRYGGYLGLSRWILKVIPNFLKGEKTEGDLITKTEGSVMTEDATQLALQMAEEP